MLPYRTLAVFFHNVQMVFSLEFMFFLKGDGLTSILHRMGVVQMRYDFKDLMAFGMFLLSLLTFI